MTTRAKKRLALLLTVVVVGVAGLFALSQLQKANQQASLEEAKQAGLEAHEAGDHLTAVQKLGFYLNQSGDAPGNEAERGELWLKYVADRLEIPEENNAHIGRAMFGARQAQDLMPDDPRPLERLVDLYGRQRMLSEQLEATNDLLEIDPGNFEALQSRAVALLRLGRREEAMGAAEQLAETHPDDIRAHEMVLLVYENAVASPDRIRAYADQVASEHPDDPEFLLLEAGVEMSIGDEAAARAAAEKAIELPIETTSAFRKALRVLDGLQMTERAGDLMDRVLENRPEAGEFRVIAAERAWQSGRPERAREILEAADPDLSEASDAYLGWLSLLQVDEMPREQEPEALTTLRKRSGETAEDWVAVLDGYRAMRDEEWSDARDLLRDESGAVRPLPLAVFLLGETERKLGEWRSGVELWQRLAQQYPNWVNLRLSLASALLAQDEVIPALGYAFEAMRAAPNQLVVVPTAARAVTAYLETAPEENDARRDACLEFLHTCREQFADSAEIKALLARSYAAIGRDEAARGLVGKLVSNEAGSSRVSAESLNALLAVSRRRGWGFEEGLRSLGAESADRSPALLHVLASEAARDGDPEEGERMLREAVRSHEGEQKREFQRRLAVYLDRVGDPEAADLLKRLAEEQENSAQAQLDLLRSSSAWSDPEAVRLAVQRLKNLAGEYSTEWRIHEARRLLTFEPTDRNVANISRILHDVVQNDPQAVEARRLLAESLFLSGEPRDRIRGCELLEAAIRENPDRVDLYPRLISKLQEAGETQRAANHLRTFSRIEDVSDAMRRRRAELAAAQGMWDIAIDDMRAIDSPSQPSDALTLTSYLRQRGDRAEAQAIYEDLVEDEEASARALRAAAGFFASEGDIRRAESLIERIEDDPAGRRARAAAQIYEQQRLFEQAEESYRASARAADTADAWNDLARFLFRRARLDEAAEAAAAGLERDGEHRPLQITQRTIQLARGEGLDSAAVEEMLAVFDAGENPTQSTGPAGELLRIINEIQRTPDQMETHIEQLRAMAEANPTFWPARRVLCGALVANGDMETAAEEAVSATNAMPADPRPAQLATELLAASDQVDRAASMARAWRERTKTDPFDADVALARLELRRGRPGEAMEALSPIRDRIEQLAERRPDAFMLLTRAMALSGSAGEAKSMLESRSGQSEEWALRYLNAARTLTALPSVASEWIDGAASDLDAGAEKRITIGQAWYELGMASGDEAHFGRAVETLEPALEDDRYRGQAAGLTAASLEAAGDLAQAERFYRMALAESERNPAILNNLAYLLIKTDGSMEEALSLAERAVELAPEVATFLDTEATALLGLARYSEAETAFRKAIELDRADPVLRLGLAEALAGQNRLSEAREALDRMRLAARGRDLDERTRERIRELESKLEGERAEVNE